ncbi:MAG: hypothetical protein ABIU97_02930 [Dehalococcoidia bacterium]
MHDHDAQASGMPAKDAAAKPSAPAKPDPHAGHDMGKMDKPMTPPKKDAATK